jgi:hypothetical protein
MGNEIKIKDLDISSTSFLPAEIKDIDGVAEIYSLEDEFTKTKKNKNIGIYLTIGLFFVVVIGSAFAFSVYIQSQNKNVEINISEFEDIRLKEVIDSARNHENNLDLLEIKLEILKVDQSKQILEVKQKYYQRELELLAEELPEKETDLKVAQIRTAEQREIAAINRSFDDQVQAKVQEIEDVKQQLAEKKIAEESGKQDSVSNVDRLNTLKMEELKKSNDSGVISLRQYYENYIAYLAALYNPIFGSSHIKSIVEINKDQRVKSPVNGYHPVFQQEGILSYGDYQHLQQKIADNRALITRMQRVPYQGTVSPSLNAISNLTNAIENDYEILLRQFATALRYKNGIIANYQVAFDTMLANKAENGYIINAENDKAIHIQLNEIFGNPINTTAIVFREDDEYIGKIKIGTLENNGVLKASVVELAKNKTIQPFDKILLEIN